MTDMAAEIITADKMTILKNAKILVNVEEALPDILVVSYLTEDRKFQGVLLDASKRDLPLGITNLHPVFGSSTKQNNGDKLYSVNQRFVYLEPNHKFDIRPPAKSKPQPRAKMTVRLRPRKVLCSKCKGICNENSENVDLGRKRKSEQAPSAREKKPYLSVNSSKVSADNKTLFMGHSLIPRLSRLQPSEISNAINGSVTTSRHEIWLKNNDITNNDDLGEQCADDTKRLSVSHTDNYVQSDIYTKTDFSSSDFLSENRNIESSYEIGGNGFISLDTEDLSKNDLNLKKQNCDKVDSAWEDKNNMGNLFSNARTLKISFGEGEGTVVKIPAIVNTYDSINEDSFKDEENVNDKEASKAAKKALKKAKKHARKRITLLPTFGSPRRSPGGICTSPRYVGALSPRYAISSNTVALDLLQRRHKHKVKHKKKHRLGKKIYKNILDPTGKTSDNDTAIKERCLKQKLSISLKRLSTNSYAKNDDNDVFQNRRSSNSSSDTWEEENCVQIPDFPVEILSQEVSNSEDRMNVVRVGDVVWGKVTGFPWWPGKVFEVRPGGQEAHVSWYASNTSSLMPCRILSPFLEDFKIRFNKKKRGPYKEAVKLATIDAQREETDVCDSSVQDPLASPTALSAVPPRPIDVLS